jgi:hypothetical protein
MPKKAVSLTLDEANVLWLKGRAYDGGNLSAAVDDLITAARAGRLPAVRNVVGTIDIAADDPRLERADREMRVAIAASLSRPLGVSQPRTPYEPARPGKRSRRRG